MLCKMMQRHGGIYNIKYFELIHDNKWAQKTYKINNLMMILIKKNITFVVNSGPGVGAHQQSGSEWLLHHLWILLSDDLNVSGQESDISRQSVGEWRTWDVVSLTCRKAQGP